MFQIQGRTFTRRKDGTMNLKQIGIEKGFSLYHAQSKRYLCPDQHGNVNVNEEEKYLIRKVFPFLKEPHNKGDDPEETKTNTKERNRNHNNGNHGNNPFIQFGQEYRKNHPGEKVKIETITETWNRLDSKTKQDRYGCKKLKKETTKNEPIKRKRSEHDDNDNKEEKENPSKDKKPKKNNRR